MTWQIFQLQNVGIRVRFRLVKAMKKWSEARCPATTSDLKLQSRDDWPGKKDLPLHANFGGTAKSAWQAC